MLSSASGTWQEVRLDAFGPIGQGGDDTEVLRKAILFAASNGKTLRIPASGSPYRVSPLNVPSHSHIGFDTGVVIQALPGFSQFQRLLNIVDAEDVEIEGYGATLQMLDRDYKSGEYRHCVYISGSSNVRLTGFTCFHAAGDGIYISGSNSRPYSDHVYLEDLKMERSRRQGLTVTSAKDLWVRRCQFAKSSGAIPESGIDLEPEADGDHLENVHLEDNLTASNGGDGVRLALGHLSEYSAAVSISIVHHQDRDEGRDGFFGSNENRMGNPVRGYVSIDRYSTEDAARYGICFSFWNSNGPNVLVRSADVVNANRSRSTDDNTAVAVIRGGGGVGPVGNIRFVDTSIKDTNKTPYIDHYFTVTDYSHIGIQNVSFESPSELMGARFASPLGFFEGLGVNTFQNKSSLHGR